jgi:hypothetical protein
MRVEELAALGPTTRASYRRYTMGLCELCGTAALLLTVACAGIVPRPSPTPQLPPPRDGAASCSQKTTEPELLLQLNKAGISVTAVSESTDLTLFPDATSVCLFDVRGESFEVAFFATVQAAVAMKICETQSGGRFTYRVDGHEFEAAYRLYWTVSNAYLVWTNSETLSEDIRRSLGGTTPSVSC